MSKLENILLFMYLAVVVIILATFLLMIPWKEDKVECVLSPSAEQQIEFIEASKSYSGQWCRASGKTAEYCNDDWQEFINCVDYPECGWDTWGKSD